MRALRLTAAGALALLAISALAACGGDDNTANTPTRAAATSARQPSPRRSRPTR